MDTCRHFFGAFERFSKADIFGIRSPPIIFELYGLGLRHTEWRQRQEGVGRGASCMGDRGWKEKFTQQEKKGGKAKRPFTPFYLRRSRQI